MQEELNEKTIALTFRTARFSADALKKAMKLFLKQLQKQKGNKAVPHGKMSVKDLVGQGQGAANIEIKNDGIRQFEKIARKYHVDFAVKKDKTVVPPKYLVFFKGKDTDVIAQAFKEYVQADSRKKAKPPLRPKLEKLKQQVAEKTNLQKVLTKQMKRSGPEL